MTDKSWKLLAKLINACGYDITEIEDEFDFDELCDDIKNRLARKTQECEELKRQKAILKSWSKHLEQWKDSLLKDNDRYRRALEEIEKILKDEICEECPGKEGCKAGCKEHQCLDIINKAKGEEYKDTDEQ